MQRSRDKKHTALTFIPIHNSIPTLSSEGYGSWSRSAEGDVMLATDKGESCVPLWVLVVMI